MDNMNLQALLNYIGLVIGVAGLLLSVFLYRKSTEAKEPRCYYKTYRDILKLSGEQNSSIKLFYGSEEVERVFTTYVWFWNSGRRPISKSDIPQQSNIALHLTDDNEELKILDYKTIKYSRDAINFSVSKTNASSLALEFDFLDQNDGAVIEIQHTGGYEAKLTADGIILGAPEGIKVTGGEKASSRSPFRYQSRFERPRPRRFVKESYRDRIFLTLIFAILILGLGYLIFSSFQNVSVSTNTLQTVLKKEIPGISDATIQKIIQSIQKPSARILSYGFGGLFLLYFGAALLGIWSDLPFPDALYFDMTQEKQTPK